MTEKGAVSADGCTALQQLPSATTLDEVARPSSTCTMQNAHLEELHKKAGLADASRRPHPRGASEGGKWGDGS
eukprot:CAMPEP_0198516260 /NCGR_PEP_ID=MMETSP1462-20131121/17806_1 /TAXON_ID=1333877 /ORGANISM="Brandtodinium nutriculum, Strain RCC3387" /LENGTH=72 /DNA_ID=CAMNT_0044245779 /DNA_START=74 /DNA_END=290 /DNA_ORIENTATION=+